MCWKNYRRLGFRPEMTAKGGVLVCLNRKAPEEDSLLLMAHLDTLGAMVAEIGGDGRLRLTNLGGMNPTTPRRKTSGWSHGRARCIPAPAS